MFLKWSGKILDRSFADKHLAFTVLDEFLEIVSYSLRGTEVLHILGDLDPHLLAHPEEMIDTVFAGHHHRLELIRANPVFPEFLFGDSFDMVKGSPVYVNRVFLFNVVVW
jgi:hypothetical protein